MRYNDIERGNIQRKRNNPRSSKASSTSRVYSRRKEQYWFKERKI